MAATAGPIADLSYRNYDGPLDPLTFRWWAIAKMFMRLSVKKRAFWGWSIFSAVIGYGILSMIFYVMDSLQDRATSFGQRSFNFLDQIVWKDQLFVGFSLQQIFLFLITLFIGAGVVANDNRANALLVYLSKPCTKFDYLFGKWVGMFLLILAVTGVPALLFLGFNWLSYRQYGHWDNSLFFRTLLIIPLPAILHASIMLGLSSLFKQARIAGATYAGIYFLSSMISEVFEAMRMFAVIDKEPPNPIFDQLYYLSVDGMLNGLAKLFLNSSGAIPFAVGSRDSEVRAQFLVPPPNGLVFGFIFVGICALFLWIAWKKVRAVEVVGS